MSILSVSQDVAKVIGLDAPDSLLSSSERESVELVALAREMADRISLACEWQKLKVVGTITGDGVREAFDLPADYARMLTKSQLWSSQLDAPLTHILDSDQWLGLDVRNHSLTFNAWTLYGDQIHIKPAIATGAPVRYFYQSSAIVKPDAGANRSTFTADTDSFRLSERLLELGMIWQWRANKGLPYAEDMMNYERLLEKLIVRDKGSRILKVGTARSRNDADIAFPATVTP